MKHFILMLTIVVLATTTAKSQIAPDTVLVETEMEWRYVKHNNYLEQDSAIWFKNDTAIIHTYISFPKKLIPADLKLGHEWDGDSVCYLYTKRTRLEQTLGGRLVLYQLVLKKERKLIEKTNDEKLWFLTKRARKNNQTDKQFRESTLVDSLLKN